MPSSSALPSAQALEPSTLIPLQLLAPSSRVVLVGDPRQLPATVVSRAAAAASLAQSLFERLHGVSAAVGACLLCSAASAPAGPCSFCSRSSL